MTPHSSAPFRALLTVLLALPVAGSAQSADEAPSLTATIHRDGWGAPHVLADTDEDAVFGMAWALAEDDWPLIEGNYLHALGRYAELVGPEGLADDWMARALEIVRLSVREYEQATPRMRGLLDAYAAGLNAWLGTQAEDALRVLHRVEPWYPLALIRYKYYQNEFLGYAGLRGEWADRLRNEGLPGGGSRQGAAAPTDGSDAVTQEGPRYVDAQFDHLGRRARGSNQWALAPSRTADGRALLLINPHQSFVGVQRYAEIHVDSREGMRFSGLTVFGFLLPYMGHNDVLGWAYTDNYADHSDLYALTFDDPDDPLAYRYDEGHRRAETWADSIYVETPIGLVLHVYDFWRSHHGPIVGVDDRGRPLAVRMAGYVEGGWFDQWDAMIRASSAEEWRDAAAMLRVAYMNAMYADRDGIIGYVYGSAVPSRLPGVDPEGILDGADPRTEWQGMHGFDELPQVWNPSSGWLLNTNSTPFTATADLPFDRDDFPAYMVGGETDNLRAQRSRQVLERLNNVTLDAFSDAIWDTHLLAAADVIPMLVRERIRIDAGDVTRTPASAESAGVDEAVRRLEAWDGVAGVGSVETTWFVLMVEARAEAARGQNRRLDFARPTEGAEWTDALARALTGLRDRWGTTEIPWGQLNRHQRPLPGAAVGLEAERTSLPVDGANGGLGSVFSYYSRPVDGPAGPRIGTGGNSFVKVVAFGAEPEARSILNYGQSGDPASGHFFDQAALYSERSFKPAWFSREDVEANSARSTVVPRVGARAGG